MSSTKVELVFGGALFLSEQAFDGIEKQKNALSILHAEGINTIDTAVTYGESEVILGKLGAFKTYSIDTKFPGGFGEEVSTKEVIIASADASLKRLQAEQVDVYYFHTPDRRIPWAVQIDAVNTLYQDGKIKRFGLSNFLAEEVEEVVRIAKEKNWIVPTVYQGNYSAVARHAEKELFPVLRRHNIQFYAYSPIAGGFLTKSVDQLLKGGQGRWDPSSMVGGIYHSLYNQPSMLEGLRRWEEISAETGISQVELAYRWIVHNSGLKGEFHDKVIFGSSSLKQLKETLAVVKRGPLSAEVVQRIEEVWKLVETDAPLDNYNRGVLKLQA